MTLFDFEELTKYWAEHPPLHIMVAAYLGAGKQHRGFRAARHRGFQKIAGVHLPIVTGVEIANNDPAGRRHEAVQREQPRCSLCRCRRLVDQRLCLRDFGG